LKISVSQENLNTIFGILAILFWGTTIAFSRSLTEQLGPLTAASCIYLLSGIWSCIYLISKPEGIKKIFQLPISYLVGCGALFVFYMICLYLAVGLAFSREQVIEVSIINYLWSGLTLVFSLPILHEKAKITLIPGAVLAFSGFYLATVNSGMFSWEVFKGNFQVNYFPYLLAFMAAISLKSSPNHYELTPLAKSFPISLRRAAVPFCLARTTSSTSSKVRAFALHTFTQAGSPSQLSHLIISFPTQLSFIEPQGQLLVLKRLGEDFKEKY